MAGKVTGIVFITVNDKLLQSLPGATLMVGGETLTPSTGHTLYGFSGEFTVGEMECTVAHKEDTNMLEASKFKDADLTFECDTGVEYLIREASTVEPCKLSDGGGGFTLKMQGQPATKS